MNLKDQGFRFVMRDGKESRQFLWVDPSDVGPNDVDCTGMDDDAFARLQDVNRAITDAELKRRWPAALARAAAKWMR